MSDDEWQVSTIHVRGDAAYRARPCAECPWRKDSPVGRFPPHVFEDARQTGVQPDLSNWDGGVIQPKFACHMSGADAERLKTCAGFLAAAGTENLAVRLAVVTGVIPASMLTPGHDWPGLYESYDDMARANGARVPGEEGRSRNDSTQ